MCILHGIMLLNLPLYSRRYIFLETVVKRGLIKKWRFWCHYCFWFVARTAWYDMVRRDVVGWRGKICLRMAWDAKGRDGCLGDAPSPTRFEGHLIVALFVDRYISYHEKVCPANSMVSRLVKKLNDINYYRKGSGHIGQGGYRVSAIVSPDRGRCSCTEQGFFATI